CVMSKWWRRTYSFAYSYKCVLLGHVQYGAKGTAIIEQPSFFRVGKLGFELSAFTFCFFMRYTCRLLSPALHVLRGGRWYRARSCSISTNTQLRKSLVPGFPGVRDTIKLLLKLLGVLIDVASSHYKFWDQFENRYQGNSAFARRFSGGFYPSH